MFNRHKDTKKDIVWSIFVLFFIVVQLKNA